MLSTGDGGPAHLTRDDCTDCAYGSVGLELVHNREPPVLVSAQQTYTVEPGGRVTLDFTDSSDPEGVLGDGSAHNGVRFTYQLANGAGRIEPTPGYDGVMILVRGQHLYLKVMEQKRLG